ncbi:MAG: oxidoreductase [Hoeflea sp.]|uniref:oxidoreductase n=1 Tax=Hoeflea sp. TaxID=1940281 RepID=UPI0032ED22FD
MTDAATRTRPGHHLGAPLVLPCGVVLKNRILKSAMSDSLGDGAGNPSAAQVALYRRWAEGGAAVSIIGEVQGDPHALEKPGNLVLADDSDTALFARLTKAGTANGAGLWAQLGHAGALSYAPLGRPRGPSALELDGLICAELSADEIDQVPVLLADTAKKAKALGFTGVQVHAAHGFLLSQFLSPLFNRRSDRWGGSLGNRARLLIETIDAVRAAVGNTFPVAVKLNATDRIDGGFSEQEAAVVITMLDETSVDLIEISGGTYFPGASSSGGGRPGEPYFLDFARRVRELTRKPLAAVGGFRTYRQAAGAVEDGTLDMVGLARALVLDPDLPGVWTTDAGIDPEFPRFESPREGAVTAWYTLRLAALGGAPLPGFPIPASSGVPDANAALAAYEARDRTRHEVWRARFGRGRAGRFSDRFSTTRVSS